MRYCFIYTSFVAIIIGVASCKSRSNTGSLKSDEKSDYNKDSEVLQQTKWGPENQQAGQIEAAVTGGLVKRIQASIKLVRDAHPKAHGCLEDVDVRFVENMPSEFRNEIVAPGRILPAVLRFSSGNSSATTDDRYNESHGLALKVLLPGPAEPIMANLPELNEARQVVGQIAVNEGFYGIKDGAPQKISAADDDAKYYRSLDIIMINGVHEFPVNRLMDYKNFLVGNGLAGMIIGLTVANQPVVIPDPAAQGLFDNVIKVAPAYKNYINASVRTWEMERAMAASVSLTALMAIYVNQLPDPIVKEKVGKLISKLSANRTFNPIYSQYNSFVPYRYGSSASAGMGPAVKYQVKTVDCKSGAPLDLDNIDPGTIPQDIKQLMDGTDGRNFLRAVLRKETEKASKPCMGLYVKAWQEGYPSLDAAAMPWGISEQGYVKLADIVLKSNSLMNDKKCEAMSFNPGHGPDYMQGDGETQRARRLIYAAIHTTRNEHIINSGGGN